MKSIRRAARKSGLTPGYISRVLRGRRGKKLPLNTARKMARGLGISIDDLVAVMEAGRATGVDPEVSRKISDGLLRSRRDDSLSGIMDGEIGD